MPFTKIKEEILNSKKNIEIEYNDIENNIYNKTFADYKKYYSNKNALSERLYNISKNLAEFDTKEGTALQLLNAYKTYIDDATFTRMEQTLISEAQNFIANNNPKDLKNDSIFNYKLENMSIDNQLEYLRGLSLINKSQTEFEKKLLNTIVTQLESNIENNPEVLLDYIDKNCSGATVSNITMYDKRFVSTTDPNYKFPTTILHKEEIDKLISESSNEDEKKDFEYLKDNLLTISSEDTAKQLKNISELSIQNFDHLREQKCAKEIVDNPTLQGSIQMGANSGWQIKKNFFTLDKKNIDQIIQENEISFSGNNKELLKQCLKMLDGMTDYQTGTPLLDLKSYSTEESSKIYAFKNFHNLQLDIDKAIKNNDTQKVKELSNISKPLFNQMDNLISMVNQLDMTTLPANVSIARSRELPFKYTKDYESASKINGLWHTLALIKTHNLSIDEFADNPIKCYTQTIEKYKDFKIIDDLAQNDDVKFITHLLDDKHQMALNQKLDKLITGLRPFEFISALDTSKNKENLTARLYLETLKINPANKSYQALYNNLGDDESREQMIKNILVTPSSQNKKYNTLIPVSDEQKMTQSIYLDQNTQFDGFNKRIIEEPFNYDEYIKNNDLNYIEIASKLNAVKNLGNQRKINKTIVDNVVSKVPEELITAKDISKKPGFDTLCKMANLTPLEVYEFHADTSRIAGYISSNFDEISSNENSQMDKISFACNGLKTLNDKWSSRSIFGKIFKPTAWYEKYVINKLHNSLDQSCPEGLRVDDVLNGEKEIDDFLQEVSTHLDSQNIPEEEPVKAIDNEKIFNENTNVKKSEFIKTQEMNKEMDNPEIE